MKFLNKTKMLINASVVIAIALAFVMPVTASISKTPMVKVTSQQTKNIFRNVDWIEQASGFWETDRGIHYMCAVNENIVWAVGYDGSVSNMPVQEFTKTTNGGELWEANLISGAPSAGDTSMIFALDNMTAWVPIESGNPQGIWKTSDGGQTWVHQSTASFSGSGAFPNCVHFWDENDGWCMGDPVDGYFEIYTTTDGGDTWVRVPSSDIPAPLPGEYGTVGYYDVVGDTVWFGTNTGARVFKSIDRGLHWTVATTPFPTAAYVDIRFKDALNGLAMDKNFEEAVLAETSDGGLTWTLIPQTGMCYAADFDYVPGTDNMYVSTGVNSNSAEWRGASYSLNGGHTWTTWEEMSGTPLFGTTWIDGRIGWAGTFNVNETTGGIWKHLPSETPKPALTVSVAGGKGFIVTITNIGEANATDVICNITIEGGLVIKPKEFSGSQISLGIGQNFTIPCALKGIGLGFLTPRPSIKVDVTCSEGINATKTVPAKIFFSMVTLQ
jgi:photosystem II stability/assembly factor-like uncharacterized protein